MQRLSFLVVLSVLFMSACVLAADTNRVKSYWTETYEKVRFQNQQSLQQRQGAVFGHMCDASTNCTFAECPSGVCAGSCQVGTCNQEGKCVAGAELGDPCGTQVPCISGACISGICKAHVSDLCSCTDSFCDCGSDGLCGQLREAGYPCGNNSDCQSGMCSNNVCDCPSEGEDCTYVGACCEGYTCFWDTRFYNASCIPATNLNTRKIGQSCNSSWDPSNNMRCAGGVCHEGVCVMPFSAGVGTTGCSNEATVCSLELTCINDVCSPVPSDCSAGSSPYYPGDCGNWGTCQCNGMQPECTFPADIPDCTETLTVATNCMDTCQVDNNMSSDDCVFGDCAADVAAFYCCLHESPLYSQFVESVAYCDSGARQMCRTVSCCSDTGCDELQREECAGTEANEDTEISAASQDQVFGWAVTFAAIQLFLTWCKTNN